MMPNKITNYFRCRHVENPETTENSIPPAAKRIKITKTSQKQNETEICATIENDSQSPIKSLVLAVCNKLEIGQKMNCLNNSELETTPKSKQRPKRSKRVRNKPKLLNLTPLGLPKKERRKTPDTGTNSRPVFSVHDIYKNDNYIEPRAQSLETIYEERDKESTRIIFSSPESTTPKKMGRKLLRWIHFETDPSLRVVSKTIRRKQLKMLKCIKYRRRPGKRKQSVIETANKLDQFLNKIRVWEDKFDSK
jgi:hypothetical protein